MPATRPIEPEPRSTSDMEEDALLALRTTQRRVPPTRTRTSALGNSLAGAKVSGGGSIRGGTFSPGGKQRTQDDLDSPL